MAKTIKHDQDGQALWGLEDHLEVAKNRSFSQLIFELLSEKEPSSGELKIFELILNLSIDHGSDTPSAKKVIEEAKKGEDLAEAVSEGIEEINDTHGGAAKPLMEILYQIKNGKVLVSDIVSDYLKKDQKIPGFGHRIYKDEDKRATLIFEELKKEGIGGDYLMIIVELQNEIENQSQKRLPINIDGAIAVALCGLGLKPITGKAIFIIARVPGLVGHALNNS